MTGRQAGFTYLSLIILVAILGLVTATTLKVGAVLQRSRAEQELLFIGAAFSDALQSYADATVAGQSPQPAALKDLLKDPRFPATRRHLRKLYVDPMTGKADWGLVRLGEQGGQGGIVAVYSLSDAKPVKVGNFPTRFQGFEDKAHISDWKFTLTGKPATVAPPVSPISPVSPVSPRSAMPFKEEKPPPKEDGTRSPAAGAESLAPAEGTPRHQPAEPVEPAPAPNPPAEPEAPASQD